MPLLEDALSKSAERCPQCGLPWTEHPQTRCEACTPGYESNESHCHEYLGVASTLYRAGCGVFRNREIAP